MAKQCMYCGQLLTKDDARFCNDCGRSQVPSASSVAPPAPIRVKLPPKEFSRFDSPPGQQESELPAWPLENLRPPQREQPAAQSRLAKRPVRLTSQEQPVHVEKLQTPEDFAPVSSPGANSTQAEASWSTPVEEISTMVLPGWREELELLRKKRSASPPVAPSQQPDSPIQHVPVTPRQSQSAQFSPGEMAGPQDSTREDSFIVPGPSNRSPEAIARPVEPLRRELHVKVWEQEPTIQLEKQEPGPAPAVEHTPFDGISFSPDEQVEQIADLATVHWQALSVQESGEQVEEEEIVRVGEESGQVIEIVEEQDNRDKVEDQPTLPLALRESEKRQPQVTIERSSTPAPKNWASAKNEEIEDLPTRPMTATANPAGPHSPLPLTAQQLSQSRGFDQPELRPAPLSKVPNPPSPPGMYNPAFAGQPMSASSPAQNAFTSARTANPVSQPGQSFNPTSLPPLPRNPVSLPGNPVLRSEEQGTQQRQPSMSSDPFARYPSPFAPTPLPNTPRPDAATVDAALAKPRKKKKRASRLLVIVLILLLVGGGAGGFVVYYQLSSAPSITQPTQAYQNSAFGVSLSYPQHWSARVDQVHNTLSFADSTSTGQITLSVVPANGQVSQYLTQETTQLGMTVLKTGSTVTFAGSTWQQAQGTVTQRGATYTTTLYVTQHNTHFYALTFLAPPSAYAQMEQDDFAPLRASFRFL